MNNINTSGYKFSGYTETFRHSDYGNAIELVKSSVKIFECQILYTVSELQKSFTKATEKQNEGEFYGVTDSSSVERTDDKDGVIHTTFPG